MTIEKKAEGGTEIILFFATLTLFVMIFKYRQIQSNTCYLFFDLYQNNLFLEFFSQEGKKLEPVFIKWSQLYLLNSYAFKVSERIIYKIAHMQTQSSQMNVELKRWELGETSVMNETESLQDSDFLSTNVGQKRRLQKFSLPKQNKDGANAARTARITLISMVLSQSKREVV